jgi:hypothetical protein
LIEALGIYAPGRDVAFAVEQPEWCYLYCSPVALMLDEVRFE